MQRTLPILAAATLLALSAFGQTQNRIELQRDDDKGKTGQKATNMKAALWIDYSNTVDGRAEGLAVFQYPDGKEHCWLTREYGTFGPRRPDEKSGKKFVVKKGGKITQRVGILVHAGDVTSGQVAERYRQYIGGKPVSGSHHSRP